MRSPPRAWGRRSCSSPNGVWTTGVPARAGLSPFRALQNPGTHPRAKSCRGIVGVDTLDLPHRGASEIG